MTPEHVEGMWRNINALAETDPAEAQRLKATHSLSVLVSIANGRPRSLGADPRGSTNRHASGKPRGSGPQGLTLPLADWFILAALAVVIGTRFRYARRHPKVPPER